MHYKNGREVKVGDNAVIRSWGGEVIAGVVVKVTPDMACNLTIQPLVPAQYVSGDTAQALQADDALPKPAEPAK